HIPSLPAVLPFLSSDDDTTDSDTPDTPPSPTHDTPFTEITASTQRSPLIPRRRVMILAPGQPISHGRPYRYHPNGLVHMMIARKRVRPLPIQQLAMRHSVNHSLSDSSSRHSSSDHSFPDLLSTSAGPSHKRRRSPVTPVHALPLISRALSPVRADLIPSPKRVRDIGYLAYVKVGPKETRVKRVTHPAMPEDISEPAQEGATEVEELVARRVAEEMEAREVARNLETLNENEEEQEGKNGGNGNGDNGGNENGGNRGNGNGGNKENGNHVMNYGGPSHKRRRSPVTPVHALPLVSRALSPVRADLIPSPKRVRDIGYLAYVEVGPKETRVKRVTHPAMPEDILEPAQEGATEAIDGVWREQGHRTVRVESAVTDLIERVAELERDNRRLRGTASVESQRVDRLQRGMKMPNTRYGASMSHEKVEELVARRVAEEMEAREVAKNLETLNENEEEQEGKNGGNGNGDNGGNENGGNEGNGNRRNEENGNHVMNYGGFMPTARECTFQYFLKCKPHTFSGTEGVVGLTRWFKKNRDCVQHQ
nr:hypothetical protein [Tanacetum cinerariifolium]